MAPIDHLAVSSPQWVAKGRDRGGVLLLSFRQAADMVIAVVAGDLPGDHRVGRAGRSLDQRRRSGTAGWSSFGCPSLRCDSPPRARRRGIISRHLGGTGNIGDAAGHGSGSPAVAREAAPRLPECAPPRPATASCWSRAPSWRRGDSRSGWLRIAGREWEGRRAIVARRGGGVLTAGHELPERRH